MQILSKSLCWVLQKLEGESDLQSTLKLLPHNERGKNKEQGTIPIPEILGDNGQEKLSWESCLTQGCPFLSPSECRETLVIDTSLTPSSRLIPLAHDATLTWTAAVCLSSSTSTSGHGFPSQSAVGVEFYFILWFLLISMAPIYFLWGSLLPLVPLSQVIII